MLPMFGGLIVVAFVMVALAAELAFLGQAYRNTAAAADAASEAGAAMLSVSAAYDSDLAIDSPRAIAESQGVAAHLVGGNASIEVVADLTSVCVTIHDEYRPGTLAFVGVGAIDVAVTSCAEPRSG